MLVFGEIGLATLIFMVLAFILIAGIVLLLVRKPFGGATFVNSFFFGLNVYDRPPKEASLSSAPSKIGTVRRNLREGSSLPSTLDLGRDLSLDFVKGLLVLGMIAYHAGVSFIADTHDRFLVLGWLLDFVSGSWVFLCGLIVTMHYSAKFEDDARNVSRRLWIRGMKMIVLFSVLNIFLMLFGFRKVSHTFDLTTVMNVFVFGDGNLTSFEVLLGIGYVLLIAPWFLSFRKAGVAVSILVIAFEAYFVRMGYQLPGNLWIVICGLAGMTVGATVWPDFIKTIQSSLIRRSVTTGVLLLIVAAYYGISIGLDFNRYNMPVYLLGVISIIAIFYLSYDWVSSALIVSSWLQLLGRYSLISYIFQMSLIRVALVIQSYLQVTFSYWLIFFIVLFMVSLTITVLDEEIRRNRALQKSYKFIFG